MAPRNIPCEGAARRFLVDQDGPDLESPMSAKDVVRMLRNADVVENAILQFEREIVSRVRMMGWTAREYYGMPNRPPTLTRTERPRFIRTYYSIWGLMRLDASEWESRFQAMTSQELYYLWEMSRLTQSIGREEDVPLRNDPDAPPDSFQAINFGVSDKRDALQYKIRDQIYCISQHFYQQDAYDPLSCAKDEGFYWWVVMWDHWQLSLKDIVCHESRSLFRLSPAVIKQHLWNDDLFE